MSLSKKETTDTNNHKPAECKVKTIQNVLNTFQAQKEDITSRINNFSRGFTHNFCYQSIVTKKWGPEKNVWIINVWLYFLEANLPCNPYDHLITQDNHASLKQNHQPLSWGLSLAVTITLLSFQPMKHHNEQ